MLNKNLLIQNPRLRSKTKSFAVTPLSHYCFFNYIMAINCVRFTESALRRFSKSASQILRNAGTLPDLKTCHSSALIELAVSLK